MNKNFILLLTLALVGSSLTTIKSRTNIEFPSTIPLADQDILEISSNFFFDMSSADFASTHIQVEQGSDSSMHAISGVIKGGGGGVSHYSYTDTFDDVGTITNTIFISNSTYLVIHDKSDVVLFKTNPHTSEIKALWRNDLMVSGQTVDCQDAVAGHGPIYEDYIYMTCVLTDVSDPTKVSQEVFAFDRSNGYYHTPTSFPITGDKFKYENKIKIGFYYLDIPVDSRTVTKPFLVTYDQGRDKIAPQAEGVKYLRLWALVSATDLDHENDVELSVHSQQTIETLYDAFAWAGQIVISAVTSDNKDIVAMHNCALDKDISKLSCTDSDTTPIHTCDLTGFIGLGHTHAQLVVYKPIGGEKFIFVFDMTGNKFGKDWLEKDTEYLTDDGKHMVEEGSYVTDYIGNSSGGAFQFTGKTAKNQ